MIINIGNTTDDERKVSKDFNVVRANVACQVYEASSIMNPQFLLQYDSRFVNCNYISVPDWSRFYWISDIIAMPGNRCRIMCKEDVLMSNRDAILALNVQVSRQQQKRNKLIIDHSFNPEIMSTLTNIAFPNARFNVDNGYNIVMAVIGGKAG